MQPHQWLVPLIAIAVPLHFGLNATSQPWARIPWLLMLTNRGVFGGARFLVRYALVLCAWCIVVALSSFGLARLLLSTGGHVTSGVPWEGSLGVTISIAIGLCFAARSSHIRIQSQGAALVATGDSTAPTPNNVVARYAWFLKLSAQFGDLRDFVLVCIAPLYSELAAADGVFLGGANALLLQEFDRSDVYRVAPQIIDRISALEKLRSLSQPAKAGCICMALIRIYGHPGARAVLASEISRDKRAHPRTSLAPPMAAEIGGHPALIVETCAACRGLTLRSEARIAIDEDRPIQMAVGGSAFEVFVRGNRTCPLTGWFLSGVVVPRPSAQQHLRKVLGIRSAESLMKRFLSTLFG